MWVESAKGECNFGQQEIAFRYTGLVTKADEHSLFKMGAKEIASQEGCSLTFMAKYDAREGNSCHIHISLRDDAEQPVFSGEGPHGFSKVFEQFIAGLLATLRELTLFVAPNVNSYKRFVPGSFAPTALAWGHDNRSCACALSGISLRRCASSAGYPAATSTPTWRWQRWSPRPVRHRAGTRPRAGVRGQCLRLRQGSAANYPQGGSRTVRDELGRP